MQEKIKGYNGEIDSIKLVVEKLVTKQNSSVLDKLCNMINNLFNRMTDYNASELTKDERQGLIGAFKRLLELGITLYNYREYLIAVVNQNINELESMEPASQVKQETEGSVLNTPPINEVEEVSAESLNNVQTLNLTNNDQKNAA